MLTLKNFSVKSENSSILKNLNFTFEKGKTYALMGPNGSGKSTLALSVMGHPSYNLSKNSVITFEEKSIKNLEPERRAALGMFMSFQSPYALGGVNVLQLLRFTLHKRVDALELKNSIEFLAKKLKIEDDLIKRPLNDGFSGGERKKMEVLQAIILDPKFIFFDEIDTGVDVDSMNVIATTLSDFKKKGKTLVFITHHRKILSHVNTDVVLIIKNGEIVKVGGSGLLDRIEKYGYEKI